MLKQKIYQDNNAQQETKSAWNKQKQALQEVVSAYDKLQLPKLSGSDLKGLLNDTASLMFDKLTGGAQAHLTIGTVADAQLLAVDKNQAIGILKKPDGYSSLIERISRFAESCRAVPGASFQFADVATYFIIDESGELQFSELTTEYINTAGCYYVETEGGKKVYDFVQATVKAYYDNGLDKVVYPHRADIGTIINEVVKELDDNNKSFIVNLDFCRTANHIQ